MLFFDDEPLVRRENIARKLGQARRIDESVYKDPLGNCTWGYPAVFRDPANGEWLLLYGVNFNVAKNWGGGSAALARSPDGIHWSPDERAAKIDLPERRAPHQVCPAKGRSIDAGGGLFSSAFECDPPVPGLDRFNMFYHQLPGGELWTSPDCRNWRLVEGAQWQFENPDPPTFAHWNAGRDRYVLTTRPDRHDRRIAIYETADFLHYTPMEIAAHADALDRPITQIYGMPMFAYENCYVAFPWMFDISPTEMDRLPHHYLGGKQYVQFAYSLDGWHWRRGLRTPFISNGEPGEPDGGCLQASAMVRLDDGSLRFYASTSRHEHGHCPPDDGYIVAYSLRRDGFVYLESDGGVGLVGTRPLYWVGGEAELNLLAPAGWVRTQVTDTHGNAFEGYTFADSEVMRGDDVAWVPKWTSGRTLDELTNRMISIEVQLENARLYAIRGNYLPCRWGDVKRLEQTGVRPDPAHPTGVARL
jgi:hypothetical protein